MHELAICQGLLSQVEAVAESRNAAAVHRIKLRVGPLSGIEPHLLEQAFSIARSGTRAQEADLDIEITAVQVRCRTCGATTPVEPNRLLCGHCGDWRVEVTGGDEMVLMSVELSTEPSTGAPGNTNSKREPKHV